MNAVGPHPHVVNSEGIVHGTTSAAVGRVQFSDIGIRIQSLPS